MPVACDQVLGAQNCIGQWHRRVDRRRGGRWHQPRLLVGQPFGDEHARGRPRFDVALDRQPLIGPHHRVSRDIELLGELARGRQAHSRRHPPLQNRIAQLLADLAGQGRGARSIEEERDLHRRDARSCRTGAKAGPSVGPVDAKLMRPAFRLAPSWRRRLDLWRRADRIGTRGPPTELALCRPARDPRGHPLSRSAPNRRPAGIGLAPSHFPLVALSRMTLAPHPCVTRDGRPVPPFTTAREPQGEHS